MRIILGILFFILGHYGIAQNADSDLILLRGNLYGGLPIEINIHVGDEINGYVTYGSNRELEYQIEGEKTSEGYALYEIGPDQVLSGVIEINADQTSGVWNSIDYSQNTPISFQPNEENVVVDHVTHQSYVAVAFPRIDEEFEKSITGKVSSHLREIEESYGAIQVMGTDDSPNNRFENRTLAVHKVTLDSDELLSGFITFFDNQSSDVHTITYNYDRQKKEMLGLTKIFKKNFDYSFFLKQYIRQKKNKTRPLLSALQSNWIEQSSFHHYVLTDTGLRFFNDYNSIFGRHNFTIPYHEISSSIGHKTINNYIKKRK